MNVYMHIQELMRSHYEALVSFSKKKYGKESLLGLVTLVFMVGGYHGFRWYQKRKDVQAFAGLIEISKSYDQALTKMKEQKSLPADEQKENPWEDTQLLLEAIASSNSGSSLAPFFGIYQAQLALLVDGDYEKSCKLMEKAVRKLPKTSPYYEMFNIKRIKMLLDNPQESVRAQALEELDHIGKQKSNYYAPEALSLLAQYHAYHGNMTQAIDAWKLLAQEDHSEKSLIGNPFVTQAQETLKSLTITW